MAENEVAENRPNPDLSLNANPSSNHVSQNEHEASSIHEQHHDHHYSHVEHFEPRH